METPIFDNILCPKAFKKVIHTEEFTSMYVPIWVLDIGVELDFHAEYRKQAQDLTYKKAYNGIEVAASNTYKLLMDDPKDNYKIIFQT